MGVALAYVVMNVAMPVAAADSFATLSWALGWLLGAGLVVLGMWRLRDTREAVVTS